MDRELLTDAGVRSESLVKIDEILRCNSVDDAQLHVATFSWQADYHQAIGLNFKNFWTNERIEKCLTEIGQTEIPRETLVEYVTDPRGSWYARINFDRGLNKDRKESLIVLIGNSKHKILRRELGYE